MRRLFARIIFFLIACSSKAQSVDKVNPAEKRLKEIISIINKYDAGEAANYIRENYAPGLLGTTPFEEHLALIARISDECKKLTVASINAQTPGEATALVHLALTDVWRQLAIRTESSSPDRITFLTMRLGAPPPGTTPKIKPISDAIASKELDELIKKLEKENIFSGTVLIAKKGKIIFHKAYGLASREYHYPNTLSTKFIIGSINKMFTATAILQLIEQGNSPWKTWYQTYCRVYWQTALPVK
jgi:hypothetical protein